MTPREKKALDFIKSYIDVNGYSPSYAEIADQLGVKSKSAINSLVVSLEDRGLIRRNVGSAQQRARCIELVDDPWQQVGEAAKKLLESIQSENIDNQGIGTVTVDAAALGDLDVALSEAHAARSDAANRQTPAT